MCNDRWSDLEKALSQTLHLNGLSPVCLRKWRVSSSDLANRQVQPSHVHTYGFSPSEEILIILEYRSLNVWVFMQKNRLCSGVWGMCTCVCPSVGFQVRTLCVDFIAAFKVTPVDPPFLFSVYESITSCCHLKWLTVRSRGAGGAHHFKLTENKIQDLSLLLMPLKCF